MSLSRLLRRYLPDLATLAASMSVTSAARGQGPPATVDRVVREAIGARLGASAETVVLQWRSVDPSTPDSISRLVVTGPRSDGLWTVEASSVDHDRWTASVRVGQSVLAPIATRRLPRGTVLNESDMTVARVVLWELPVSATARPQPQAGWVTRRVVAAREVLREPAVGPAPTVAAGQPVLFVYNGGLNGLRLSVHGIARSAAALGDRVAVRLGPKRSVAGIVVGPGLVTATDTSSIP